MKLHIKYDINICCKIILQEQLDILEIPYTITGLGEVEIKRAVSIAKYNEFETSLRKYGIEIINDPKNVLTQKIKDAIVEMVYLKDALPMINISAYLAKKLNRSYAHLSATFSEVTFTTIQNFMIVQKIERAKHEINEGRETLTEIAFKLNFSSVAHLSSEFKRITGLTPSAFKRIIRKRKETDLAEKHHVQLTKPNRN